VKKLGTEQYIPQIKDGFIKTMQEKYNTTKEEAEKIIESFLRVIEDASDYLFSLNHSLPYSMIGFACGYLRKYYTIEYLTVLLNINEGNQEKTTKIIEYAKSKGIKVKPIEFGKSKADYFFDKTENTIYRGCASIKYLNKEVANELYELSKNKYNSFIDLLVDIVEKTSANTRQIGILIQLNYFKQFGENGKLLSIYKEFTEGSNKYDKKYKDNTKIKRITALKEIESITPNKRISLKEQIKFEQELLGYIQTTIPNINPRYVYVMDIDTKFSPKLNLYCLAKGTTGIMKVSKWDFEKYPIETGDVIYINKSKKKSQKIFKDGKFIENEDVKEYWVEEYTIANNEFL
jgi:DNA polymerase-3 subunit alpha